MRITSNTLFRAVLFLSVFRDDDDESKEKQNNKTITTESYTEIICFLKHLVQLQREMWMKE